MTAGSSTGGKVVGRRIGRKHVEARRRTRRLAPGVICLCILMILASLSIVASPAKASGIGPAPASSIPSDPGALSAASSNGGDPLLISPGTWVTFQCAHGTISLGGTQYCSHTTTAPVFLCDSTSCPFTMVGTVDSGYTFYGWNLSGQAAVSCEFYCLTTTLTLYAPSPSNHYTASVQLDTTSKPPPPPTCGGAPTMSTPTVKIQSWYRQTWVNWTYTIPSPGFGWTPGFSWSLGSTPLSIPSITASTASASINLNDLTSGTTYSYTAAISNCGGSATKNGAFTTSNAPTNEFVGWVSQLTSNSSELNQVSSTIPSASVWLNAYCQIEVSDSWAVSSFYPTVQFGQVGFLPGVATSSSGAYTLGFPEVIQYTILATGNYNIPVTVTLTLSSTGTCTTSDSESGDNWMGQPTSASNSHYLLFADEAGYWNATVYVSSALSATNDYAQFGLERNTEGVTAVGVGFIHSLWAGCTVGLQSGTTQQIDNYVEVPGWEEGTTNTGSYSHVTTASAINDSESNIALDWNVTGVVNETYGVPTPGAAILAAYTYNSQPFSHSADTVSFPDPDGSTAPAGTANFTVGPLATAWENFSNGGSFASTGGLNLAIGLSGGWGPLQFNMNLLSLQYTSTSGTNSAHSIDCSIHNPSRTQNLQYYMIVDDTQASSGYAINVHLWFDRYCNTGKGCE